LQQIREIYLVEGFLDVLKAFDKKITKRMTSLQKRKIKPRVEIYKSKRIIVERLDFRSLEFSYASQECSFVDI
jgi:ASC-1-like (ASCH) protein